MAWLAVVGGGPAVVLAVVLVAGGLLGGQAPSTVELAAPVARSDALSYEWREVAIGGGGFITGYSADVEGRTRLVRTDVYGAYIWNASRNRWVQLVTSANMPLADRAPMTLNTGVYEAVVAPSNANRIYLAMGGWLYRSDDRGVSFAKTSMPQAEVDANSPYRHYGPFIAVHPRNPDLVMFGTPADGLWRSEDGGTHWLRIASVPPSQSDHEDTRGRRAPGVVVWFTPGGDKVWAMSAGSPMMMSSDGGKFFSRLGGQGAGGPLNVRRGAFTADGIFYGVDPVGRAVWKFAGGVWSDLTRNPGIRPAEFGAVAVTPVNGQVYVFDLGGRGYLSSDGGNRWSRLTSRAVVGENEPPWLRVVDNGFFSTGSVVFDPVVPNRLWNAAGAGPFFADVGDGGTHVIWTSHVRGIEELVANDVVAPPGQSPLFAAWDFGVHVRNDLRAYSTTYGPKRRALIAVQQVDWSASDPAFLVTNASDTRKCCSEDGDSVLAGFSEDGGKTWSKFASLPQPPGVDPKDPWRMSYGTIAVSSNDTNNIVWAPANNRSPFYTLDRGVTWRRVELPGEILPFTGSYANYYNNRRTVAADRVLPTTFYLYHAGEGANGALTGLWVTTDGGRHWARIWIGEITPSSRGSAKLRVVPGYAGQLFFTPDQGFRSPLKRSVDGGRTWVSLPNVSDVHDIAFGKAAPAQTYPAIYIAGIVNGTYGIWRSIDSAQHWTMVGKFPVGTLDEVVIMDADKDVFGRVYLGFKGSGWRYGQPSDCQAAPYTFESEAECFALQN